MESDSNEELKEIKDDLIQIDNQVSELVDEIYEVENEQDTSEIGEINAFKNNEDTSNDDFEIEEGDEVSMDNRRTTWENAGQGVR